MAAMTSMQSKSKVKTHNMSITISFAINVCFSRLSVYYQQKVNFGSSALKELCHEI